MKFSFIFSRIGALGSSISIRKDRFSQKRGPCLPLLSSSRIIVVVSERNCRRMIRRKTVGIQFNSRKCLPWRWFNTHICLFFPPQKIDCCIQFIIMSLKANNIQQMISFPTSFFYSLCSEWKTYNLYLSIHDKSYPEIACIVSRVLCAMFDMSRTVARVDVGCESVGGKQLAIDSNRGRKLKNRKLAFIALRKKKLLFASNAFSMSHCMYIWIKTKQERNSLSQLIVMLGRQCCLSIYLIRE